MPYEPRTLSEKVDEICAMVDDLNLFFDNVAQQQYPQDLAAAQCAVGCTFCCHIEVAVSMSQVIALKRFIERERPGIADKLKSRIRHRRKEIGDEFGPKRRAACPLLGDDGLCAVYEGRPLSCRALLSFDVGKCREGFEAPARPVRVPHSTMAMKAKADLLPQLVKREQQRHLVPGNYELIRALHIAFQYRDFEQRCLNGDDVLKDARIPTAAETIATRHFTPERR